MVDYWSPGTSYGYGAVVEYEGAKYKIIQPHTSQGDWTPPATPALWGRVPEGEHEHNWQPPRPEQPPPPPQDFNYGHKPDDHHGFPEQKPFDSHPDQKVDIPHEETKKHWYDLDDKRKQELEVGGGLLAGLAVLGAGYYAYHEHGKNEEEKKALTWGLQTWLQEAQRRTDDYRRNGPQAPTTWVLTEGHNIPQGALVAGQDKHGKPYYVARAFHEGGIQTGHAGPACPQGAVVGYAHKQIDLPKYEILLGDPRAIQWVPTEGHLHPEKLGARLVEGGNEKDGTKLYIAQAEHDHKIIPGKCGEKLSSAMVVDDGKERESKHYRVLCYH